MTVLLYRQAGSHGQFAIRIDRGFVKMGKATVRKALTVATNSSPTEQKTPHPCSLSPWERGDRGAVGEGFSGGVKTPSFPIRGEQS